MQLLEQLILLIRHNNILLTELFKLTFIKLIRIHLRFPKLNDTQPLIIDDHATHKIYLGLATKCQESVRFKIFCQVFNCLFNFSFTCNRRWLLFLWFRIWVHALFNYITFHPLSCLQNPTKTQNFDLNQNDQRECMHIYNYYLIGIILRVIIILYQSKQLTKDSISVTRMSACVNLSCEQNCCNFYGQCPVKDHPNPEYRNCYQNYGEENGLSTYIIVAICIAAIVFVLATIGIMLYMIRRSKRMKQEQADRQKELQAAISSEEKFRSNSGSSGHQIIDNRQQNLDCFHKENPNQKIATKSRQIVGDNRANPELINQSGSSKDAISEPERQKQKGAPKENKNGRFSLRYIFKADKTK